MFNEMIKKLSHTTSRLSPISQIYKIVKGYFTEHHLHA